MPVSSPAPAVAGPGGPSMRRSWIFWLLMLALTLLVITRFASLKELHDELAAARWSWIAVSLALHFVYYGVYAALYQRGFAIVGVQSRIRELLPLVFASYVVNSIAPAGGAAAAALFIGYAVRHGQNGTRAAVGMILVLITDVATLLPFLAWGTFVLHQKRDVTYYDMLALGCFVAFVAILAGALALAARRPALLRTLLGWTATVANRIWRRFRHQPLVGPEWQEHTARELADASAAIAADPRGVWEAAGLGVVLHLLNLAVLVSLFPAFSQPLDLGAAVAGFGLGIVFFFVAIVPQGIAVVEGIMALVFTRLGVPGEKAGAIALVFRGVNYWLPLAIGALFTRQIGQLLSPSPRAQQTPDQGR